MSLDEILRRVRDNDPTLRYFNLDYSLNHSYKARYIGCKNELIKKCMSSLPDALKKNVNVKSLTLRSCYVRDEEANDIANTLHENEKLSGELKDLDIAENSICNEGITSILKAFEDNTSLEVLSAESNKIGDVGAKAIANLLYSEKEQLLRMTLDRLIGPEGAIQYSHSLTNKSRLGYLDLSYNPIGDKGLYFIARALETNTSLKSLILSSINVSVGGAKSLANAMVINKTLKVLRLSENKIMDKGAYAFAQAIALNSSLENLFFDGTFLRNEGANAIAAALVRNNTLRQLDLSNNAIGDFGKSSLAVALTKNKSLRELRITNNQSSDHSVKKEFIFRRT